MENLWPSAAGNEARHRKSPRDNCPGGFSALSITCRSSGSGGPRKPCRDGPPQRASPPGTPPYFTCAVGVNPALRRGLRLPAEPLVRRPWPPKDEARHRKSPRDNCPGAFCALSITCRSSGSAGQRKPCHAGPRPGPSRGRCRGWHPGCTA